jgi:NurA-like 5'-3' nuclease
MWDAGERLTEEDAEIKMRELSPIMLEQEFNEETGKYTTRLREISELSNAELVEYIDHLKQIAAEEYSIYIEDPQSI